ncbi:MAG: hypothetical protein LBU50_04985, partial [Cellulomonas sp.]|nr:hypothetical protein [Cellulomonas sp.]
MRHSTRNGVNRTPLIRTLVAAAAVAAVAVVAAPATHAASDSVTWGGPGDVNCGSQVYGNDDDLLKADGISKIDRDNDDWDGPAIPGVSWT